MSYLPTSVRGILLIYLLVIDVWSRKIVAWDVAEREDPKIAAELVSRACLRERVSNDNPYSESCFRTVKYRSDHPRRSCRNKDEASQWVAGFVDW